MNAFLYFVAAVAALGQPKLDSFAPVQGGTQFVFTLTDPARFTIKTSAASEGGKHVLVLTVTDDGALIPPGPGPVPPTPPVPGPTPPPSPPTPPSPQPQPPGRFGLADKAAKWAVDFKLPADQCQAVAKNYRSIVSAIAAGALKASDIKAEALRRNQEVLGDAYADWLPWRNKLNAAIDVHVKSRAFTGTKDDFSALYAELATGLEAVK